MNKNEQYYQLIPEKIYQSLNTLIELLRPEIKSFNPDYLKEVISVIAFHVQKSEGAAPLNMVTFRRLIPNAERYLYWLIRLGIIERSGRPKKGVNSYQYSFTSDFSSKYIRIPLNNAKLIRRFETVRQYERRSNYKLIRGRAEQTKYLRQLSINDDYQKFLDENYNQDTEQYNFILQSATRILNGDIFYSVDNTSHRFHSNVTNMAKGLRSYLRIKGEPLLNIDIRNSQPYLSTIILTDPPKVSWLTENVAFAMLLQSLKVSHNEDVKKYVSLAVSGQIYEFLMNEFFRKGLSLTRDETKSQVLRILFARNRLPKDEKSRECRLIFKKNFPTVYRIFNKVRGNARGNKFQNFRRFAILLQRIEAYLMLDIILKRIYKELPGTIAITIHDSIMTGILTNNVEAVRKIMIDEFEYFVGFPPQIKIEDNKTILREIQREETLLNQYAVANSVINN